MRDEFDAESDPGLLPTAQSRDPMTLSDTSPMYRIHDIGEASSSLETAESPHALSEKVLHGCIKEDLLSYPSRLRDEAVSALSMAFQRA